MQLRITRNYGNGEITLDFTDADDPHRLVDHRGLSRELTGTTGESLEGVFSLNHLVSFNMGEAYRIFGFDDALSHPSTAISASLGEIERAIHDRVGMVLAWTLHMPRTISRTFSIFSFAQQQEKRRKQGEKP